MLHLVEHGRTRDVQHAADDYPAGLAARVGVNSLNDTGHAHGRPLSLQVALSIC